MALTVKGGGGKPEEEKTVTAETSAVTVNPTSGKTLKKVTVNPTPTESKTVTPTTSVLTVTPSTGKHLSSVKVNAVEDVTPEVNAQTPVITNILESLVGKVQGANATADKILEGYSAYVGQKLINGTAKDASNMVGLFQLLGFTKMAVDEFVSANKVYVDSSGYSLKHSLGEVPKIIFLFSNLNRKINYNKEIFCLITYANATTYPFFLYSYDSETLSTNNQVYASGITASNFKLFSNFTYSFSIGTKYTLITMA